jgi:hypothetical protein
MLQHFQCRLPRLHESEREKSILAKVKVRLISNEWTYVSVGASLHLKVELIDTGYRIKAIFFLLLFFAQNKQHSGARRKTHNQKFC